MLEVVASDGDAAQSERVAMHSSRPSVSVKDLKEAWEKLGGDYSTLEFKPTLQDHFLQQQERSTVTADAASKWSQSLGRAMSVAADAEVFVKVMNDNMHKNKCKELEVQVIVSSLLLGVAGAGLFGVSSLPEEHSFMKTLTMVAFCISTFSFMASAMISTAFLLPFLSTRVSTRTIMKELGSYYFLPYYYFGFGYFTTVLGATAFFLCMVPEHTTWTCLLFCGILFIAPTFGMAYKVYASTLGPAWSREKKAQDTMENIGWQLLKA